LSIVRGEDVAPTDDAPPNSLFAPPGHPDAAPPERPSTGDTLLRELLGREHERGQEASDK